MPTYDFTFPSTAAGFPVSVTEDGVEVATATVGAAVARYTPIVVEVDLPEGVYVGEATDPVYFSRDRAPGVLNVLASVAEDADDLTSGIGAAIAAAVGATFSQSPTAPADPTVIWLAPLTDTTPPTVPTGLTATPTMTGVDLAWSASTDTSGAIGEYRVYRDGVLLQSGISALTYADTSAAWDTLYSYTVLAADPFGNASAQSSAATATRGLAGAPVLATSLSGAPLVAHFRASDLTGLYADGANIPTLENRVSDGADLVPFGAPKFETGSYKPSIVFDGTNDAATAAIGVHAQAVTKFVVFRLTATTSGKTIVGTSNSSTNRETFATGASQYSVYAGSTVAVGPAPATTLSVAAIRYQAGSGRVNVNGTVYAVGSPGTEAAEGLRIAANTSGATRTAMELYEVAQYAGAVADAALDALVVTLKTWYGVA